MYLFSGYHRHPKHHFHGGFDHHAGYGGYGHHCEEIAQDSCYNEPIVKADAEDLTLVLPIPRRECQSKTVELPKINCQITTEQKCLKVPVARPKPITVQKCTPEIGAPKCREVELILPKQVCRDLIIGYAEKILKTPKPKVRYPSGTHNIHSFIKANRYNDEE